MAEGAARMPPACRTASDSDTDQTASAAASATGAALGSRPLTSVRATGDSSSGDEEDAAASARRPVRPLPGKGAPAAAAGGCRRRPGARATAEQASPAPAVEPFDRGVHFRAGMPATLTAAALAKHDEQKDGSSEAKGGGRGGLAAGERAEWAKRNLEWLERTSGRLADVPAHTLELLWSQQRMQRRRERRPCSHALSGRWTSVLSLDVPCGAGRQSRSDAAMIRQSLDSWQGRNARRDAADAAQKPAEVPRCT
ncbi:unnamed protein product [Prorocentrum cordatum]|uniref:Selenoprotein O n=1 Tax=Prorocentrum cordatum TaxID=2364126 RepID=A0ABN9TIB6_9DINO|nr:unnamed protein product [Polarella glacialis]